tara:strand:+ start:218 stop:403 length:186 start_codon:yes stop_codon:yes gene_type:complete
MKLQQYLNKNKISVQKFSEDLGIGRQSVYAYIWGVSVPRAERMNKIDKLTKGEVSHKDWFV